MMSSVFNRKLKASGTTLIFNGSFWISIELNFKNTFIHLNEDFFQIKAPDPVVEPYLAGFNPLGAELIGLGQGISSQPEFIEYFSGNKLLPGSQPLAMSYSGFQFGSYNPRLGDGRGVLVGEALNSQGEKWDVYLKGAGPTRFARGFDGRATLRSSIREYLGGEAIHGLGIPTTRSLAIIGFRELIFREKPELPAILTRLSPSHIRFGNFDFFYYTKRYDRITELANYVIQQHHPEWETDPDKYFLWYSKVIELTASLIAGWQAAGFAHGVLNTDNMSVLGLTFDYGPYGFMDRFNPHFIPNSSDTSGRYAFSRQPEIGFWNLQKFGLTLSPLLTEEKINEALSRYQYLYNDFYRSRMAAKLGLIIADEEFKRVVGNLFQLLAENQVDYTNFFRNLSNFPEGSLEKLYGFFADSKVLDAWFKEYKALIDREGTNPGQRKNDMDKVNPKFILRNYLAQKAIDLAIKESDFSEIQRLQVLLQNPFEESSELFDQLGVNTDIYAADTPQDYLGSQVTCSA